MPHPCYFTTPIYYVNDRPHIGHVYTSTITDVLARMARRAGRDTFFLTGTDEHGVKVEQSAKAKGISPKALADENAQAFRAAMALFHLTNDDFIRTTDADHERQVGLFLSRLIESGDVYLGEFEGWYDEGEEEYYTETKAQAVGCVSPVSGRPLVRMREKNYYFRLSAYQARLEQLFRDNPHFVRPEGRRNEVLGRLRDGLQDVPVSRTNFTWGIPVPGESEHVVYVWIDALMNYITALGLAEPQSQRGVARAHYWPATCHMIGKEILWFHAVIWPALLMALTLPLPGCVYAHSFWISEGRKMSKTLGNFIDLPTLERYIDRYGLDALRYYLVTQGPLGATDTDFAAAHFHDIYHAHLVNTVGNCSSRVSAMIGKYFDGALPADPGMPIGDVQWDAVLDEAVAKAARAIESFDLAGAAECALSIVRTADVFINATEPFKVAKDPARRAELAAILRRCAEAVCTAAAMLEPVMPERMGQLLEAFSDPLPAAAAGPFAVRRRLTDGATVRKVALFPRVEAEAPPPAATR